MTDQSPISALTTSPDTTAYTFSPGSQSGTSPSIWPGGEAAGYGQCHVPASLSARQAKAAGLMTSGTCARLPSISSASADLGRALASRLQAKTALRGSTLYKLTWKERVTPSGRSIPALRASALPRSGSVSTGWPTPTTRDWKDGSCAAANVPLNGLLGRVAWLYGDGTAKSGSLNPALSRWLQGIPQEWDAFAPMETRLTRSRPKPSSAPTSMPNAFD